jgi:aminoglycoside phosphotransferase (APT) family kinase protein
VTRPGPELIDEFHIGGKWRETHPYGSGHINDTFAVRYDEAGLESRYILQRINTEVFPDLDALSGNLERITNHLRAKISDREIREPERRCLRVIETRAGNPYLIDAAGQAWRMFRFIDGTRSVDRIENPQQAFTAARAFGSFAADLADLPAPPLAVTIPDFHDLPKRIRQLEDAATADTIGRAAAVRKEIDQSLRQFARIESAQAAGDPEGLTERAVHNDCKLNNLLLDARSGEALCVIDLDTVMPGRLLFDFGELVRSGTCRAPEDEADLSAIHFDRELFDALARGYLSGASEILDASEIAALPLAGPNLTLENAVRFLADHLAGDRYFRIERDGHNLDRARAQLRLLDSMLDDLDGLRSSIERAAGERR